MNCKFCGEELFDEYEESIGGHQGCIEEMRFYEEEARGDYKQVTATLIVPGKGSCSYAGYAKDAYRNIVQMIKQLIDNPGASNEAAFSIVIEDGGAQFTLGHPDEILALAKLDMEKLGLKLLALNSK